MFQIRDDSENDAIWQVIRDMVGDVYAKMLLQKSSENEYYKVIQGNKLVLVNSNVQQMLIKPI